MKKNTELFARIDLDRSRFEKERTQSVISESLSSYCIPCNARYFFSLPAFVSPVNVVWMSNLCLYVLLRDLKKNLKEYVNKVTTCESKMAELQRQVDSDKVKAKDGSPLKKEVVIHFRLC